MNKTFGKILRISGLVINVILVLIIALNLIKILKTAITGDQTPTVLGIASAVVLTDSMAGDRPDSFRGNDMIFTVKQRSYAVDDIIMFRTGGTPVTHRIIDIEPAGYVTKGDANNTEDTVRIMDEYVIGKVFLVIPGGGGFIRFLTSDTGTLLLVAICMAIIFLPMLFPKQEQSVPSEDGGENNTPDTN